MLKKGPHHNDQCAQCSRKILTNKEYNMHVVEEHYGNWKYKCGRRNICISTSRNVHQQHAFCILRASKIFSNTVHTDHCEKVPFSAYVLCIFSVNQKHFGQIVIICTLDTWKCNILTQTPKQCLSLEYLIFNSTKRDPKINFHTYFRFDRSFISCLNIWSFKSSLCSNAKIFGHKWHLKWSECILIMWSCSIFSVVKLVEQWEQANGLSVPRTKKKIIYHTSIYSPNHNI